MKKLILVLALSAGLLASCAGDPLRQANLGVRETYRSPAFTERYNGNALGLLTAAGGDGRQEYKNILGEFVEEALKKERPDLKIVPYWESLSSINSKGFTPDYAEMLHAYATTGILDRDRLKKLGIALDVRYFVQPRLINFQQRQSTRFSLLGLTLFKTHESEIKIYLEMWDAHTGNVVWIGVAETNMASEKFMARPIPFEEVARYAIENLIKKMP
ncbi:MAG: hypothetical protein A2X93_08630 [Deltaproteobacteria bacterium GWC2_56_8]|nr:MAG: hypothetical protein A2X99_07995 [Deltaproteobacteria bacterium GWB2_55_19]OGP36636.1 MAG: hypothetical protein A2X93_08630 [Deltaproteobacteria bacterium GWC2_56_8]HAO93170.1 hypothetical protein [Deltaproteobacteria bacterium]